MASKNTEAVKNGIFATGGCFIYAVAIIIHVLTIVIAFSTYGILGGALALIAPILSEIVMFLIVLTHQGFWNLYCVSIVAVVLVFVIMGFLGKEKK